MLDNCFTSQAAESLLPLPSWPGSSSIDPKTIAFIDPAVYNSTALAADLQVDAKFILDPSQDGIAQITEILGHYQGVTGIDIVAHGTVAGLQLGNASLSSSSLPQYASFLQQWRPSLAPGADILFYACNVAAGAAGQAFVTNLSTLTGADIAASTDLTGDPARGGNWDLEYTTGRIETAKPFTSSFISSYHGLLPTGGDGFVGPIIESAGTTQLGLDINGNYIAKNSSGFINLKYNGVNIGPNSYPGWSVIGAEIVGADVEMVWKDTTGRFWYNTNTDSGSLVPNITTKEAEFKQDFNSDGFLGSVIESAGTTQLGLDINGNYIAKNNSSTINLKYNSVNIGPNSYPGWSVIGAEIVGADVEMVWKDTTGRFWYNTNTDSGSLVPNITTKEAEFKQDFNSDGFLGSVIESAGTTQLGLDINGNYIAKNNSSTINLKYNSVNIGPNSYPGWSVIGAEIVGADVEMVWKDTTGRFWYNTNTDNGSLVPDITTKEAEFKQDFNSDGFIQIIKLIGTPAQNQILTADTTDIDGLTGVTISYQWQQSDNNGTTWTNIAGATNKTITLAQAQVGSLVRSTASFTDVAANLKKFTSAATPAVVNVNDVGTVVINGNAVTGNTLTAAVNDIDGLNGVAIAYKWQQSSNGNTWGDIAAATSKSLSLDNSLVGKQVRVNAVYTDAQGTAENIFSVATLVSGLPTLFPATATPDQTNFTDGPGVDWEYGMQFTSKDPGEIRAIRYYKAPSEDGAHIGNIWSSTGQLLASVAFTNETASGWQQQDLTNPVFIDADATYVVSVNTNGYYAVTSHGFDTGLTNGSLTAPVGAGVYNETEGAFPSLVYFNENYYRDVVFVPGTSIALKNNDTIFVSESDGFATVTAVRKGSTAQRLTVEYTTNEIGGAGAATAGADFIQPSDVRPNTGLIVFEVGETEKTFKIPIVNDNLVEGTETFAVGLQNTTADSLGSPRTVLIAILDDDSPTTISMSNPTVSISEQGPRANITVQRSGNIANAASVSFSTSNGTALAGSDYIAQSGIINFAARQLTQTISIPIVNDTIPESTETFTVTLSNPTNAVLGSQITSTITILDDDLELGTLNRQVVVNGLNAPTAFDWTPDGRYMLVAQKDGEVRVVDNGILRTAPLIDLSDQVNDTADRGLIGMTINPNFATNPYVYLLYTYDPPETQGQTGLAGPDGKGNRPGRLVRVKVDPTTMVADPASLKILAGTNSTWAYTSHPELDSTGDVNIAPSGIINGSTILAQNVPADQIDVGVQDNDPTTAGIQNQNVRDYLADDSNSHSIGAVHFGPDGYLYLTVGDGTSYNFADPRAVRVQDISNLSGKVLRIDPVTGAGVPGNPFYEANNPNSNQSKVFYSGVRNAFRFTFDPVTKLPVIGDVGWNTWEEINTGAPGSNFGWPYFEGPDKTGTYQNLPQAIAFYDNGNINLGSPSNKAAVFPILSRKHGAPDFANAMMVGDFYNSNTLMFGDVNGGTLYAATFDPTTRQVTNVQVFDSNIPLVVDMEMGPDGFLYGVDIATGQILRWNPA